MPAYTHEYTIAHLPREDIGSDTEVIKSIHVRLETSDGTHTDNSPFVHTFDKLEAPFAAFDTLDKATILGWIPAADKAKWEAAMEASVDRIAAQAAANSRSDVPAGLA